MARTRGFCCLVSRKPSGDARRSSAACICCIGPHHRPSGGSSCVPCLAPNAEHSVRAPLTSCCGSGGGNVRRRSGSRTPSTPKTPCTPTARRLCGARSRTPHRGQVCCFPAAPKAAASAGAAAAASARTPGTTPSTPIGRSQRAGCIHGPTQGSAKTGTRRRWLRSARQAVVQTPRRAARAVVAGGRSSTPSGGNGDVVKVYSTPLAVAEEAPKEEESACSNKEYALLCWEGFAREDVAAVTIQAYFRAHLARRAFKALRSLVRLQAVARGAYVRRQAEVAVHCMQAMARLQVRVRARQMHAKPNEEDKLLLQS